MFTGIIEQLGKITAIEKDGSNINITVQSSISQELKIDQSVSHNGVCLTVVATDNDKHTVTAIDETLLRTNLGSLKLGDPINLERAMQQQARLDGHMVQGHVDTTGKCIEVEALEGSWYFHFEYQLKPEYLLVDKGSICINGVSLTVVSPKELENGKVRFSVAIIPYTFEHTNFKSLHPSDKVNLEFDVIGKYVAKYLSVYQKSN